MNNGKRSLIDEVKALFFQMTEEELESNVPDSNKKSLSDDETEFLRGGNEEREEDPLSGGRSEYWYSNMEENTDENAKRSRENKLILSRLDLRTTWIMRILLAIVTTVAVSYLATVVPV